MRGVAQLWGVCTYEGGSTAVGGMHIVRYVHLSISRTTL